MKSMTKILYPDLMISKNTLGDYLFERKDSK